MVCKARAKRYKLMLMATTVKTLGPTLVKPALYFSPIAHAVSNIPATNRYSQAIATRLLSEWIETFSLQFPLSLQDPVPLQQDSHSLCSSTMPVAQRGGKSTESTDTLTVETFLS